MKIKLFLLLFVFVLIGRSYGQQNIPVVTGLFTDIRFGEFIEQVETDFGCRFFFREDWIKDISVDQEFSETPIDIALNQILTGHNVKYVIDQHANIILTPGISIKTTLFKEIIPVEYVNMEEEEIEREEGSVSSGIINLGNPANGNTGRITITGNVKDVDSGEPVVGAVVYISDLTAGTMTDGWGYYSLTVPKGLYRLEYSCLGLKKRDVIVSAYGDGRIDIDMEYELIPLKGITVTANAGVLLRRAEIGLEKLNIQDLKLLPTSMGETDIIKTVLFLPGVLSVGEASAGFNVRGGSADQNMVLLYDSPIFNTSHFFGFFSAVNPAVIKDISLYKGGIPARYGGRISSVLEIVPRSGNMRQFEGSAGISPITSQVSVEGPIVKDKSSFILAARSTYSNWILKMVEDPFVSNSIASFYDINGRFTQVLGNDDKLEFSVYTSNDRFRFNQDTLYSYNNSIASLSWRHIINSQLQSTFSGSYSSYDYNIESKKEKINSFSLYHNVKQFSFRSDFNYTPNFKHDIGFGLGIIKYGVIPGEFTPASDSSLIIPTIVARQNGLESAIYVTDMYDVSDNFTLNAGIRFSAFTVLGPDLVYDYDPGVPVSDYSVVDSTQYSDNKIVKTYGGPELRLSATLMLNSLSSIKLSYNHTRQYIHQLSNTTSVSPTDIWVLTDSHLRPQVGDQFAIGFYRNMRESTYETSLEVYYKDIRDMIDFKSGAKLLLNENIERDIVNTLGKAYGLELMIRKKKGRFNGWVSYTYSRILMKSDTDFESEVINSGEFFPANHDKPHSLTVIGNYMVSRRLNFSSTYTYSSGRPITYPVASYGFYDINLLHYSNRNMYRIPYYSRIDLSLTLSLNLKNSKIGHSSFTASIYNALGRSNVYSVFFRNENSQVRGYQLSVFARPIPSITYNIDF